MLYGSCLYQFLVEMIKLGEEQVLYLVKVGILIEFDYYYQEMIYYQKLNERVSGK